MRAHTRQPQIRVPHAIGWSIEPLARTTETTRVHALVCSDEGGLGTQWRDRRVRTVVSPESGAPLEHCKGCGTSPSDNSCLGRG